MHKIIVLLSLVLSICCIPAARAQQYLKLDCDCASPQIAFSKVHTIDNRAQGQLLGYVQKGAFNSQTKIEFKGSLADSLARFFQQDKAFVKSDKELALVLNYLFLSETSGAFNEDGKMKLSVRLFTQTADNRFSELLTIDSTFICTGFDVTHKMLRSVSKNFCLIAAELAARSADTSVSYALDELPYLDSLEMLQVPIFTGKPAAGIYKSYKSFMMNTPDVPMELEIRDREKPGRISVYKIAYNKKGDRKKVWLQGEPGIYAISDGENLIKSFEGGRYFLKRGGDGFYFDSPAIFSNEAQMWGAMLGGLAGAAVASSVTSAHMKLYRYKINPRTGRSVPVMMVQDTAREEGPGRDHTPSR